MVPLLLATLLSPVVPLTIHPSVPGRATPPVITIQAADFSLRAPATIPAGFVTLRIVNSGKELHHASLFKLASGKSLTDLDAALKNQGPLPAWVTEVGGPNAAPPGGDASITLNLGVGTYAMLCGIPSPDGVPHFAKGMQASFTVVPAKVGTPIAAPVPDVVVTLKDYDFVFSKPLTAGTRTIKMVNEASQGHEMVLAQLAPDKTAQDFVAWAEKMQGPPPITRIMSGTAPLGHSRVAYVVNDITPGNYVLICFVADAKDGKPHFVHGMLKELTVS